MKISIVNRFKPFSHTPGVKLLLPGTDQFFQVYPEKIITGDTEIPLDIKGPVKNFTVEQDLEKGSIRVFGHSSTGYFEKKIANPSYQKPKERLSLGVHKAQEWDLVKKRQMMSEILPFWHFLGQVTPIKPSHREGTAALLDRSLEHLFLAGFEGILSPRLQDTDYQGFDLDMPKAGDPLILLTEGAKMIKSLFLQEEPEYFHILPRLPSEFHCGRLTTPEIDMEWSKHKLRKLIVRTSKPLLLPKEIKRFRLKGDHREKGEWILRDQQLPSRKVLVLDRFER
ncbi:MAG: hypothetical protein WD595_06670 [Waddliaceae bacterium]